MTTRVGPALCVENIISFYLHAGSIGRIISLIYKMLLQSKGFKNGYNFTVALQFLRKCEWIIGGGGGGGGGKGGAKGMLAPLAKLLGGTGPLPLSPSLPFATTHMQKAAYLCHIFWRTEDPYRTDRQKDIHR